MSKTTVVRNINAPVEMVFSTISDIHNFSKAVPDIVNVEMLSGVKSGVGTRFRETREMNGKEVSTELEVTEYAKNNHIRIVSDTNGTIWDSLFTVEDQSNKSTKLKLEMDAKAYKLLSKIINPIMKGFIKKALEKDMDAVKIFCEK